MNANYLEVSGRTYYAFEEPEFIGPVLAVKPEAQPLLTVEKYNEGEIESKFWRRQFGRVVTTSQRKFDWIFGIFMPLICFFFDPIVFRSWYEDDGLLAAYRIFAYLLSGTAIMGLSAWLLWGERLKALNAPLAGLFAAAGLVAALVGIPLLPLSVFGSVVLIGFLGFTPFFTAVIFLRNALRAGRAAAEHYDPTDLNYVTVLSFLAGFTIPWIINAAFPVASRGWRVFDL